MTSSSAVLEQHVRAGAEICQGPAEHQPPFQHVSRFERLPQDQQRLNDAALAHAVQAAQQVQRRARQVQRLEALEVPQSDSPQHQRNSRTRSRMAVKRFRIRCDVLVDTEIAFSNSVFLLMRMVNVAMCYKVLHSPSPLPAFVDRGAASVASPAACASGSGSTLFWWRPWSGTG